MPPIAREAFSKGGLKSLLICGMTRLDQFFRMHPSHRMSSTLRGCPHFNELDAIIEEPNRVALRAFAHRVWRVARSERVRVRKSAEPTFTYFRKIHVYTGFHSEVADK